MKTEDIVALIGIAGIAFALWEWKPQQQRVRRDAQNLSNDWWSIGGDIRTSMRRYEQRGR